MVIFRLLGTIKYLANPTISEASNSSVTTVKANE